MRLNHKLFDEKVNSQKSCRSPDQFVDKTLGKGGKLKLEFWNRERVLHADFINIYR